MHPKRYKGKNKKRSQSEFPPTEHSHVWTVVINMLTQQASDLKQNKNDKYMHTEMFFGWSTNELKYQFF